MKYMLMMNTPGGGPYQIFKWPPADIQAHIAFMRSLNAKLAAAGELVAGEGLTGPDQAKVVRAGSDGRPITDGVFPETKEFLAGYWIVDVDSAARAYAIAAEASAAPGPGGKPLNMAIEVREVMSGPPKEFRVMLALDANGQRLLRDLAPRVLGALVRHYRDFGAAEDALQEALIAGATQWPGDGVPDDPAGWLFRVAARRVVDHVRAEAARRRRESIVVSLVPPEEQLALAADAAELTEADDALLLLFMCCHPALSTPSAIALTLRACGGLTTSEIARAFLVPEATMAQRISRAKENIRASGVPFERPTPTETAERLGAVLHVLYLISSEGYSASSGPELARTDLSSEALRLTRMLHALLPDDAEVTGLLALMLLTDARRAARTGSAGELIPLDEQDRSLWDRASIAEGTALVSAALPRGTIGSYQLQAAIAALHDEAPSTVETDWPQILALYGVLMRLSDNPMVALNHAVALAMVHGPDAGLARLDALDRDSHLAASHRLDAVRAHLLERSGDRTRALAHYTRAAERTTSIPERNYLLARGAAAARSRDAPPR